MAVKDIEQVGLDTYKFGFHDDIQPVYTSPKGLSEDVVREISRQKDEPGLDVGIPAGGAAPVRAQVNADVGRRPFAHRL